MKEIDPNDDITNIIEFSPPFESSLDGDLETLGISIEEVTDQNMTLDEMLICLLLIIRKH